MSAAQIERVQFNFGAGVAENLEQLLGISAANKMVQIKEAPSVVGTVTRYRQEFKGVPVWGKQIVVHKNKDGAISKINGDVIVGLDADFSGVNMTETNLNETDALNRVKSLYLQSRRSDGAVPVYRDESIKKVIYVSDNDQVSLAYFVGFFVDDPTSNSPARPNALIGVNSGELLEYWDGLTHAQGIGPGGNEKTGEYEYGTDFGYMDVQQTGTDCLMNNVNVKTIDLNHGSSGSVTYQYTCPRNTHKFINGAYSPLNDAHYFGGVVFDMYQDWMGQPPLTFQLTMRVHYGNSYENAFWNGLSMTFGDGATRFYPLVGLDIVGHEVSHGFTEQNSGLIYSRQSGGLNEAFSDMSGEAAEYYMKGTNDWLIGAEIFKSAGALRYMNNPPLDSRSIDHVDDYYDGLDVHYSSGIFNKVFYLISTTSGWTTRKAFEVMFVANRDYWTPSETFDTAACGVLNAAMDLRYNAMEIVSAFDVVGVVCANPPHIDSDGDGMTDIWEISFGLDPDDPGDASLDNDTDGLTNLEEFVRGTDPTNSDSDGDSLSDGDEINVHGIDPTNTDTDGDSLSDGDEINIYGTDPTNSDTDADGMPDGWEIDNGLNPLVNDAALDNDGDGLNEHDEYLNGADPFNSDTDADGLNDGDEVHVHVTDPNDSDSDDDGLTDGDEVLTHGTNPNSSDTDADGMSDGWEITNSLDPLLNDAAPDVDADGLSNLEEYGKGTDPHNSDTDGDGVNDKDDAFPLDPTRTTANYTALFYNPGYVDTSREGPNVIASLVAKDHIVTPFTGITAADFTTALATADTLLIPELEDGPYSKIKCTTVS